MESHTVDADFFWDVFEFNGGGRGRAEIKQKWMKLYWRKGMRPDGMA